jgi:hypothetical protein
LKGAITFLEDLEIFRRYSDREWIVIVLLSISIPKTFKKVDDCTICASGRGHSPGESVKCKDPAVLLDFNRKIDICTTFKTIFTGLFE